MAVQLDFIGDHSRCTMSGLATAEEFRSLVGLHHADPRFEDVDFSVVDIRSALLPALSANDLFELAALAGSIARAKPSLRLAVVVHAQIDERQWGAYLDAARKLNPTWAIGLFDTPEPAIEWGRQRW